MESEGLPLHYLKCQRQSVISKQAGVKDTLGVALTHADCFLSFEGEFSAFKKIILDAPTMDLVVLKRGEQVRGLEIKLTAIPDSTTSNKPIELQGPEIVVRQPTIKFLAASICNHYIGSKKADLRLIVGNRFEDIKWESEQSFLASFMEVKDVLQQVADNLEALQQPLIIQPIWRTVGKTLTLEESCFDVAIWSDVAFLQLILNESSKSTLGEAKRIDRTLAWIGVLLHRFIKANYFNSGDAISQTTYSTKNDKAFSLSGMRLNKYLPKSLIESPRVPSSALKSIILGEGVNHLSPERRLDAAILGTWGNLT